MNLHEYQAKEIFTRYGIPVPQGQLAASPEQARAAAKQIGGDKFVVKAQVHAGGRGKAGGVKLVEGFDAVEEAAKKMLGQKLVTKQTGAEGLPINSVWVEKPSGIARELYVAGLVDRSRERILFMASAAGGMDIEEVAEHTPEKIKRIFVHPAAGLQPYQARELGFFMDLTKEQVDQFTKIMQGLYRIATECDASMVEVNPLIVTTEGNVMALDAKLNFDTNALFRQKEIAGMRDPSQEDEAEREASKFDLNYVTHGQRCRLGDGDDGYRQAAWRPAGELPRCRRRHHRREGYRGVQADHQESRRQGDLHQHFRRHRPLRPDRGGHHPGLQAGRPDDPRRGPSAGHQHGEGARDAQCLRPENHAG
jgi:succinyl-CoA synthetase beta subunit